MAHTTGQGQRGRMRADSQCRQAASSRNRRHGPRVAPRCTVSVAQHRNTPKTHRHTALTSSCSKTSDITSVPCVGATASHSAVWRRPSAIPADSERETRRCVAAVCQCSSGGVARQRATTRPPRDDEPDVVQGERATHGALAAHVGHTGTVGSRVTCRQPTALDRRLCDALVGCVEGHGIHPTTKPPLQNSRHRRELLRMYEPSRSIACSHATAVHRNSADCEQDSPRARRLTQTWMCGCTGCTPQQPRGGSHGRGADKPEARTPQSSGRPQPRATAAQAEQRSAVCR
jgi:hypothetical protein